MEGLGEDAEVGVGDAEDDVPIARSVIHQWFEALHERSGFGLGLKHFPVASKNNLSHGSESTSKKTSFKSTPWGDQFDVLLE